MNWQEALTTLCDSKVEFHRLGSEYFTVDMLADELELTRSQARNRLYRWLKEDVISRQACLINGKAGYAYRFTGKVSKKV